MRSMARPARIRKEAGQKAYYKKKHAGGGHAKTYHSAHRPQSVAAR